MSRTYIIHTYTLMNIMLMSFGPKQRVNKKKYPKTGPCESEYVHDTAQRTISLNQIPRKKLMHCTKLDCKKIAVKRDEASRLQSSEMKEEDCSQVKEEDCSQVRRLQSSEGRRLQSSEMKQEDCSQVR